MDLLNYLFNRKFISIFFLIVFYHQANAQRRNLIFESTFDSSNSISKWKEQSFMNNWSGVMVKNNKRAGVGSLKVQLIRQIDTSNGPRAELGTSPYQTQNEYWYGFSNFFPANYSADPASEIINQWQEMPDLQLGEAWRSPPLALEIKNDRYKIAIRWCATKISTTQTTKIEYLDIGPVSHSVWNDWIFHVKWGYNSGILQIWKNGTLVLERLNKPIGYNDTYYPYFKIGIYKWEWSMPNTLSTSIDRSYFIDEVRIGNRLATFNDVTPSSSKYRTLPVEINSLTVTANTDGSFTASFVASQTTLNEHFILYISDDDGKTFYPTYSETIATLQKEKSYTLKFKSK